MRAWRWVWRLGVALSVLLLWIVALLGTDWLVHDLGSPEEACLQEGVPLFESIEVVLARTSARPPLVRCTLIDRHIQTEQRSLWGWSDLTALALVDIAAVALPVVVWRRRRRGGIDPVPQPGE
jgi:hypothetical protein